MLYLEAGLWKRLYLLWDGQQKKRETKDVSKQSVAGEGRKRGTEGDVLSGKESEEQPRTEKNGENIFGPYMPSGIERATIKVKCWS